MFQKYDKFEEKQYSELYRYCKINIEFISTPFDHKSVDMLDKYVNFFKVSSSDITNFPLLKKISTKKTNINFDRSLVLEGNRRGNNLSK